MTAYERTMHGGRRPINGLPFATIGQAEDTLQDSIRGAQTRYN